MPMVGVTLRLARTSIEVEMKRKYCIGMRIRVRSHMSVLGGGCRGKTGTITEVWNSFPKYPFIIARLDDGKLVGLHPEDLTVIGKKEGEINEAS